MTRVGPCVFDMCKQSPYRRGESWGKIIEKEEEETRIGMEKKIEIGRRRKREGRKEGRRERNKEQSKKKKLIKTINCEGRQACRMWDIFSSHILK